MKKHNGMRPQDIVILLKMTTNRNIVWQNIILSQSLKISASEITEALERCRIAKLVDYTKKRVNTLALQEFLMHGIKYIYPIQPGNIVRGIPTAFSASPIKEQIAQGTEIYVWPFIKGTVRGQAIEPLYKTVPEIAKDDTGLYELLVIVDTLRIGKIREIEIATKELQKRFATYDKE